MRAELLEDTGTDRLPLVYVPGIDGTGELLFGTAGRLAEHFRLVRLRYVDGDDPSEAERPAAPPRDDYAQLAASLLRRLDELDLGPALLLAESFGVAVALRTALDGPERVAGLALVNGFAYFDRRFRLVLSRVVAQCLPQRLFHFGRRLSAQRALFAPRRDESALRDFKRIQRSGFDGGYCARLSMIAALDLRDRLPEVHQPVALFASDSDRVVASVRAARDAAARLPDATLEVLPRAGHLVLPLAEEPWPERLLALASRAQAGATPGASRAP